MLGATVEAKIFLFISNNQLDQSNLIIRQSKFVIVFFFNPIFSNFDDSTNKGLKKKVGCNKTSNIIGPLSPVLHRPLTVDQFGFLSP